MWTHAAWHIMQHVCKGQPYHPGLLFVAAPLDIQHIFVAAGGAVSRLRDGLMRLAQVAPLCNAVGAMPDEGPWCAAMPLWCNPVLPLPLQPPGGLLEDMHDFKQLRHVVGLFTIADVLRVMQTLQACPKNATQLQYLAHVWFPLLRKHGYTSMPTCMEQVVRNRTRVSATIMLLVCSLPHTYVTAATNAMQQGLTPSMHEVVRDIIMPRLGWLDEHGKVIRLQGLTVRDATHLQLCPVRQLRAAKHERYVADAIGQPLGMRPDDTMVRQLYAILNACWRLKWENTHKEVFWRMAVFGMEGVQCDIHRMSCCVCEPGALVPDVRCHVFWECGMARAVREEIQKGLPPQTSPITKQNMWLIQPPPGVFAGVWRVVCLACVNAMWFGHRLMHAKWRQGQQCDETPGPRQRTLYDVWNIPRDEAPAHVSMLVAQAGRHAVYRFWSELQDFVNMKKVPRRWCGKLGPRHAFIAECGEGCLMLNR